MRVPGNPLRGRPVGSSRIPVLLALRGEMRGTRLPLRDGCTVIGRDPAECHVVYASSATAISRRHCTITWRASTGELLLEDDGSSNGTYVRRGERLDPLQPMPVLPGVQFWLGTPDELWQITGADE